MNRPSTARLPSVLRLAWLALLPSGCVLGPMPEPPQATLDLGGVVTTEPTYNGEATIEGGAGAASPAGAVVRAFNLDSEIEPAEGIVEADGSFEIDLLINAGQEARLQVVSDDARSAPIDVVIGPDGSTPTLAPRPLAACLELAPGAELDLVEVSSVTVLNRCGQGVQLEQPALRRPIAGIELAPGATWPFILADGNELRVEVQTADGFATEEVFFVEASSPERDRRPITVVPPP